MRSAAQRIHCHPDGVAHSCESDGQSTDPLAVTVHFSGENTDTLHTADTLHLDTASTADSDNPIGGIAFLDSYAHPLISAHFGVSHMVALEHGGQHAQEGDPTHIRNHHQVKQPVTRIGARADDHAPPKSGVLATAHSVAAESTL